MRLISFFKSVIDSIGCWSSASRFGKPPMVRDTSRAFSWKRNIALLIFLLIRVPDHPVAVFSRHRRIIVDACQPVLHLFKLRREWRRKKVYRIYAAEHRGVKKVAVPNIVAQSTTHLLAYVPSSANIEAVRRAL